MNQALPKQIQQQLDQAAEIERQLAAPVIENPATPAVEPPQAEQPVVTPPPPQAQVTPPTQENWEQRFNVMQGKYNAEVPRLHQQLREMADALADLKDKVKTPEPTPEPKQDRVTDKDREDFGADLLDAAARAAEDVFDRRETALVARIEKMLNGVLGQVQTVEARQTVSDSDRFWATVRGVHADFDNVNADQKWFDYLDSRVPGARMSRRQLAEDAIKRFDAEALVEMVASFKSTLPVTPVAPNGPSDELRSQVTPSTSLVSQQNADTGRIWTGDEYTAAMDHRNLKNMSRAEYDALVAEAELAVAEGRVRW